MDEDAGPAPGREADEDFAGPPSGKRARLSQQTEALNTTPSPSFPSSAPHGPAPVTSSVLNTRAILSVLKGKLLCLLVNVMLPVIASCIARLSMSTSRPATSAGCRVLFCQGYGQFFDSR